MGLFDDLIQPAPAPAPMPGKPKRTVRGLPAAEAAGAAPTGMQAARGPVPAQENPISSALGWLAGQWPAGQQEAQRRAREFEATYPMEQRAPAAVQQAARSAIVDPALSLERGVVGAVEAPIGLANILSGGAAGNALQRAGIDTQAARDYLAGQQTPGLQAQRREFEEAQGFGDSAEALLSNPSLLANMAVEAVPSMVLGGAVGRGAGALAPGLSGMARAGIGEGIVSAGQQAEQTRQDTGTLTPMQAGIAVGAGAATGLLGAAGAAVGRRLGIADIDAQLAGDKGANMAKSLVNRVLTSAGLEGLEEMGQSTQEQVLGNLAADRDPLSGVGKAAAAGGILGGAMGAAGGIRRPNVQQQFPPPVPAPAPMPLQGPAMAQGAAQGPAAPIAPAQPATLLQAPKTPFAGSQDVSQLYRSMDLPPAHRDRALQLLAPVESQIGADRRGTMSWEEIGDLAALSGMSIDDLRSRRKGQAYNAEEFVAASRLLKDRTASVLDLSTRIGQGLATDIDKANFLQQLDDLRAAQSAVMGSRAEIGRALNVMKANVTDMKTASRVLEQAGGAQGVDAIAQALNVALERGGIEAMNKQAQKAGSSAFWTFYKSMLLSSPDTHAVNVVSNLATAVSQIPERLAAAGIGAGKRLLTGGRRGEVRLGEPFYQAAGMLEGMVAGMRGAVDTWRTGADPFGINKAEAISAQAPGQKVWGIPLRLLQSEDAFFQFTNEGMERYAQAYRQAAKEGGGPAQVARRAAELIRNPTENIRQAAQDQALYATFNNQAGKFVQAVNRMRLTMPGGQLIIPFLRTPANIINYAMKRTALAPLYSEVREDIRAGGARQELALARIAVGSMIQGAAVLAYLSGNLTGGGPEDKEARQAWLNAGNQPYSIKVNGQWVDYSRLDPFASLVGIAADVAAQHRDPDAGMATLVKAVGRNFTNKTWLQGLSGAMQALSDPDRYGESWVNRTGATLLQPATLLSHIGRWQDPVRRETDGFMQALQYRTPAIPGTGYQGRQGLPAKLDAWGQPILEAERQVGRAGPFPMAAPSTDPVRQEAARLGWQPTVPSAKFTLKGKTLELTAAEHHKLRTVAGQVAHRVAAQMMRHPNWRLLDDDQKRSALDREISRYHDQIRDAAKVDHQLKTRRLDAIAARLGITLE